MKEGTWAVDIIDSGIADYREVYNLQKDLVRRRALDLICDTIIITQHKPVFTLGRMGSFENLLIDETILKGMGIEFIETDRGGDITFHGPGQLVLYPIINLKRHGRDIRRYLRMLEEIIIDFLSLYGITGLRINNRSGVWIDDDTKIGSIGIGISKWITYHGLSVNINTPLHYYSMIKPCGLGCCMASVSSVLKRDIDIADAKDKIINCFKDVYERWFSILDKEEVYRF